MTRTYAAATAALVLMLLAGPSRAGVSMVLAFDAFDAAGPNAGDWYKDADNESGTLAWGESYVMMAYAAMYEATGERMYLDRLAEHADGVLAQRDDARGVTDYTGSSNPGWRASSYSDEPMCWAVHSGMLTYPMALFVAFVREDPDIADAWTYDGTTYGDKADAILAAIEQTWLFHESEWRSEGTTSGYYVFPPDAAFYAYAGDEMPLNQMNALGRTAVALWRATGDGTYLDRATRLANHLKADLTVGAGDTYMWNYWGGAYAAPGEDISHAAISVGFAAACAEQGIVFTDADMERFGRTFHESVVIDHHHSHDNVGGGGIDGSSYRPQMGRWAVLGRWDPRVVAAVRNLYDSYTSVSSGSILLGFALLARWEYFVRPFTFYHVDWDDLGDRRQATAVNANVLTLPHDETVPVFFRMTFDAARSVEVEQWNDVVYTGVLGLAATSGPETVLVAYDPRFWHPYTVDGALFQFADAFVPGEGIVVWESESCDPPVIDGPPPYELAEAGTIYSFSPTATGEEPMLWFLDGPVDATVVRDAGAVSWNAAFDGGDAAFVLAVENDCGRDEIAWTVSPSPTEETPEPVEPDPDASEPLPEDADPDPDAVEPAPDTSMDPDVADTVTDSGDPAGGGSGGCGCRVVG